MWEWGAHLSLGPTTVCLGFGFVKVFLIGLDFHRENPFLEFLSLGGRFGSVSVMLMWLRRKFGVHEKEGWTYRFLPILKDADEDDDVWDMAVFRRVQRVKVKG